MSWNFALILFVLLVVTGIVWSLDRFSLRHKRAARVMQAIELARQLVQKQVELKCLRGS